MPAKAIRTWPDTVPPPSRTLAWPVLEWMATYLVQPDGPHAGEPFKLTREQMRVVLRLYAIDAKGRFLYRRAVLRRAKGWGKSPFLAAIAAAELCGPVRFDGFGRNKLPKAVPHPAPWVQVAAVAASQTRNTMVVFPGLFSDQAVETFGLDIGKEIIHSRAGGRIEAVTSSPRVLEGGRPTLVICDETSHWVASNEGHAMAEAIRRNAAKARDGAARVVETTNAHLIGEGSVAESTYEAARKAGWRLAGVYYDALEAPAVDLVDLEAVRKAVELARGDSTWVDIDRVTAEIADPTTPATVARRYFLNQVCEPQAEEWLAPGAWAACAAPGPIPDGSRIVIGFDGSFSGDSTAVVGVTCEKPPHVAVLGCWERPDNAPADWRVPVLAVEETIRAAARTYDVAEICADPYRWARSLEVLADEGLPVVEFPQSTPRMVPATTRFAEAVADHQLTHADDERLTRHVHNAVLRVDSRGPRLAKPTKWSPRRIDLAVAAVMALDRAAVNEPPHRITVAHMEITPEKVAAAARKRQAYIDSILAKARERGR